MDCHDHHDDSDHDDSDAGWFRLRLPSARPGAPRRRPPLNFKSDDSLMMIAGPLAGESGPCHVNPDFKY